MNLVPFRKREIWINPFQELETEMNRFVGSFLDRDFESVAWNPAIDVVESKDSIVVKADLPGMNKEDIQITVQGDTLEIKGEKKQEREVKEDRYVRSERTYGSFSRTFGLPQGVDASKVKANYKNGVLELVLPKKEDVKPKQIAIDVN